jgi:hypothetical protein
MPCHHFLVGKYPLCMAVQGLMTPSLWEIRAYCTSDDSSRCPLYQRYAATEEKVPLDAAAVLLDPGVADPVGAAARRKSSIRVEKPVAPRHRSPHAGSRR